jgi:hypothetical protein
MNVNVFNAMLLAGWLLVLVGGVLLNVGAGLAVGGLLLIVLTIFVSRVAGIFVPGKAEKEGQ